MVLYLGYFALILIGIYFTFGFLKISGEGLASLGYENNFIQIFIDTKIQDGFYFVYLASFPLWYSKLSLENG